jgi:hypothetical protein
LPVPRNFPHAASDQPDTNQPNTKTTATRSTAAQINRNVITTATQKQLKKIAKQKIVISTRAARLFLRSLLERGPRSGGTQAQWNPPHPVLSLPTQNTASRTRVIVPARRTLSILKGCEF